ncbi:ketopantoate reductase family protein (plasmid) [Bacillus sp. CMF21]|nr:ketopantoate reductase family protein [Bacillus sp. CMF21]
MKVLVVGAGAVGGYFGTRLVESGVDVTFLVRKNKQLLIKENGVKVQSIHGNVNILPKTITVSYPPEDYDVILVSTKSYHIDSAVEDFKRFVGKNTVIIPLLNGISHLDILSNAFPNNNVMGGLCFIESTTNEENVIVQTSPSHDLVFGELSGETSDRVKYIKKVFSNTKASIRTSDSIISEMWAKYFFIACFSGITTLFRSSIGFIREDKDDLGIINKLINEIGLIMKAHEVPLPNNIKENQLMKIMVIPGTMKSSMLRDMERRTQIEGEHIHGYLLNLANKYHLDTPLLKIIYFNLQAYESQLIK